MIYTSEILDNSDANDIKFNLGKTAKSLLRQLIIQHFDMFNPSLTALIRKDQYTQSRINTQHSQKVHDILPRYPAERKRDFLLSVKVI